MLGAEAEADGVAVEASDVDASMEHWPSLHSYPKGQQASPHVGRFMFRSVEWIRFVGYKVAFRRDTSQVTGLMSLQSDPDGQQMTLVAAVLFSWRHEEPVGQQKSLGRLLLHCDREDMPPHVWESRDKRPTLLAARTAVERADEAGTVDEIRKTKLSF